MKQSLDSLISEHTTHTKYADELAVAIDGKRSSNNRLARQAATLRGFQQTIESRQAGAVTATDEDEGVAALQAFQLAVLSRRGVSSLTELPVPEQDFVHAHSHAIADVFSVALSLPILHDDVRAILNAEATFSPSGRVERLEVGQQGTTQVLSTIDALTSAPKPICKSGRMAGNRDNPPSESVTLLDLVLYTHCLLMRPGELKDAHAHAQLFAQDDLAWRKDPSRFLPFARYRLKGERWGAEWPFFKGLGVALPKADAYIAEQSRRIVAKSLVDAAEDTPSPAP